MNGSWTIHAVHHVPHEPQGYLQQRPTLASGIFPWNLTFFKRALSFFSTLQDKKKKNNFHTFAHNSLLKTGGKPPPLIYWQYSIISIPAAETRLQGETNGTQTSSCEENYPTLKPYYSFHTRRVHFSQAPTCFFAQRCRGISLEKVRAYE